MNPDMEMVLWSGAWYVSPPIASVAFIYAHRSQVCSTFRLVRWGAEVITTFALPGSPQDDNSDSDSDSVQSSAETTASGEFVLI
jgi:hypothetical protein